ncbi:MAG: hypothetical protein Q8Q30_00265 [Candidatus Woesebacteria bacterium]|nr:hypothetical protein [Candidatus Woesebacteria bacterium]
MRKKSRKSWLFDKKDSPKSTWRRHVGKNKKIHMIESKNKDVSMY